MTEKLTTDQKLDLLLAQQNSIMQMLCDLIEAMPDPGTRPDLRKAMAPLLDNPIFKSNPMVAGMLNSFMDAMGGPQ